MIDKLKQMLGLEPKPDYAQLIKEGAVIMDVRTPGEYRGGHVKGSVNIPLDLVHSKMKNYKKDQVIITCCASGMRSGSAKNMLKSEGFTNVHNAGSWINLRPYEK